MNQQWFVNIVNNAKSHLFSRVCKDGWSKVSSKKTMDIEELSAVQTYFKSNIKSHVLPGRTMIEDSQRRFSVLKQRSWRIIKAKVNNLIINDRRKNTE